VRNPRPLLGALARLGMPLYGCQTPDGYKNTEAAWLSPDATGLRISFATALAAGKLPLAAPAPETLQAQPVADPENEPVDAERLEGMLGPTLTAQTRDTVADTPPGLRAAVILGSPDFMRH
jgi:uncharacterized protein (DUF1800 family)